MKLGGLPARDKRNCGRHAVAMASPAAFATPCSGTTPFHSSTGAPLRSRTRPRRIRRAATPPVCVTSNTNAGDTSVHPPDHPSPSRWPPSTLPVMLRRGMLQALMALARVLVIRSAEKAGIRWRSLRAFHRARREEYCRLEKQLTVSELRYPEYYLKPFHAYREGNLCWLAAEELEAATTTMAARLRAAELKSGALRSPAEAARVFRSTFVDLVHLYWTQRRSSVGEALFDGAAPGDVLDVGCGALGGWSAMMERWPRAKLTGVDLSARFLAVGVARLGEGNFGDGRPLRVYHGDAENLRAHVGDASMDVVTLKFILHELPAKTSVDVLTQCHRVLRRGGVLAITDNDPRKDAQAPGFVLKLHASTEPWRQEWTSLDLVETLRACGFDNVLDRTINTKHLAMIATRT